MSNANFSESDLTQNPLPMETPLVSDLYSSHVNSKASRIWGDDVPVIVIDGDSIAFSSKVVPSVAAAVAFDSMQTVGRGRLEKRQWRRNWQPIHS